MADRFSANPPSRLQWPFQCVGVTCECCAPAKQPDDEFREFCSCTAEELFGWLCADCFRRYYTLGERHREPRWLNIAAMSAAVIEKQRVEHQKRRENKQRFP